MHLFSKDWMFCARISYSAMLSCCPLMVTWITFAFWIWSWMCQKKRGCLKLHLIFNVHSAKFPWTIGNKAASQKDNFWAASCFSFTCFACVDSLLVINATSLDCSLILLSGRSDGLQHRDHMGCQGCRTLASRSVLVVVGPHLHDAAVWCGIIEAPNSPSRTSVSRTFRAFQTHAMDIYGHEIICRSRKLLKIQCKTFNIDSMGIEISHALIGTPELDSTTCPFRTRGQRFLAHAVVLASCSEKLKKLMEQAKVLWRSVLGNPTVWWENHVDRIYSAKRNLLKLWFDHL